MYASRAARVVHRLIRHHSASVRVRDKYRCRRSLARFRHPAVPVLNFGTDPTSGRPAGVSAYWLEAGQLPDLPTPGAFRAETRTHKIRHPLDVYKRRVMRY